MSNADTVELRFSWHWWLAFCSFSPTYKKFSQITASRKKALKPDHLLSCMVLDWSVSMSANSAECSGTKEMDRFRWYKSVAKNKIVHSSCAFLLNYTHFWQPSHLRHPIDCRDVWDNSTAEHLELTIEAQIVFFSLPGMVLHHHEKLILQLQFQIMGLWDI